MKALVWKLSAAGRRLWLPVLAVMALLAGCGEDGLSCGPGTTLQGGVCKAVVDAVTCGSGTSLADGFCIADDVAASTDTAAPTDVAVGSDTPEATDTAEPTDTAESTDTLGSDTNATDVALDPDACIPNCASKDCGDDGCGGSCGSCTEAGKPFCNTLIGQCEATCVPDCLGKNCGDNGCGATCGTCTGSETCSDAGRCIPPGWTCPASWYAAGDACDCGCGAADPDCSNTKLPVGGCTELQTCDNTGTCVDKTPAGWTCPKSAYGALDACDCDCGAADPDCAFDSLPLSGCKVGQTCGAGGQCKVCTPNCTGKTCGPDGCGGLCGTCDDPAKGWCDAGTCVSPCSPTPTACKSAKCGSDGCGGSCGSCGADQKCEAGTCVDTAATPPWSCKGSCGSKAPDGCSCASTCEAKGTCCPDYDPVCKCTPKCNGKGCGPDGCGGTCGTCSGTNAYCNAVGQCTSTCTPQCTGKSCGPDGCGGTCGTCGASDTCAATTGKCVPSSWKCDPGLYGDKLGCDCGCGSLDPDCADKGAVTLGCPSAATTCSATGQCAVTFCSANSSCQGQWCTGAFYAGNGKFDGVCAYPDPTALSPGSACSIGAQCATGVCLAGQCRSHCNVDADCPTEQLCLALPVAYGGQTEAGFAGVCGTMNGNLKPCKAQADCSASNQKCIAVVDAQTLGPRYLCALVPTSTAIGSSCSAKTCPDGQFCAVVGTKAVCTSYCPGGNADCPQGWKCGQTALHSAGTADLTDDPKVAVCTPN